MQLGMNREIVLEFIGVDKQYRQGNEVFLALSDVSFQVKQGQIIAIIGASGSGKSTLLHIAGLLDVATKGSVSIFGQNASAMTQKTKDQCRLSSLGFIYQYHHLLPDFTALENILMPKLIAGCIGSSDLEEAKGLMQKLGIFDKQQSFPGELSGGQQQRVAIARAMINKPNIILADEPTGNLDSFNSSAVFEIMSTLARQQNVSILIATHSLELANKADVILELKNKQMTQIK
jgi:lipoprotein-releasing system ATP-binding protein